MAFVTLRTDWFAPGNRFYRATIQDMPPPGPDGRGKNPGDIIAVEVPDELATEYFLPPGSVNLTTGVWVDAKNVARDRDGNILLVDGVPPSAPVAEPTRDHVIPTETVATEAPEVVTEIPLRRRRVPAA